MTFISCRAQAGTIDVAAAATPAATTTVQSPRIEVSPAAATTAQQSSAASPTPAYIRRPAPSAGRHRFCVASPSAGLALGPRLVYPAASATPPAPAPAAVPSCSVPLPLELVTMPSHQGAIWADIPVASVTAERGPPPSAGSHPPPPPPPPPPRAPRTVRRIPATEMPLPGRRLQHLRPRPCSMVIRR